MCVFVSECVCVCVILGILLFIYSIYLHISLVVVYYLMIVHVCMYACIRKLYLV